VTGGERVRLGDRARDRQPASGWRNTDATQSPPNRLRTLYGTAKAANAAGDLAMAEHYSRGLNRVADKADTPSPSSPRQGPIWRDRWNDMRLE
jgi:hypothetical protein